MEECLAIQSSSNCKTETGRYVNKTIKLKIVNPIHPTGDWDEFKKIMKQLQAEVREASTRVISKCNLYYGQQLNAEIDLKNKETKKEIQRDLYSIAKNICVSLYSKGANSISQENYRKYFNGANSYMRMIDKGEGNPPMGFKKEMPIPFVPNVTSPFSVTEHEGNNEWYDIGFPLVSSNFKNEWNENLDEKRIKMVDGRFKVGVLSNRTVIKKFFRSVLSSDYKLTNGAIVENKNRKGITEYWLHLSYKFIPNHSEVEIDPEKVCGIDLGINKPITCATNFNDEYFYVKDNSLIKEKVKRKKLLSFEQAKVKYNGNSGHGRNVKLGDVQYRKKNIKNYNENRCHEWVSDIFKRFILPQGCGVIHMEKLTGFYANRSKDKHLKEWPYYKIQLFIINKAAEYGIEVKYVNARYTSQTCSACGHVSKENRPKGKKGAAYFRCVECGHKENADVNAARVIATAKPLTKKQDEE